MAKNSIRDLRDHLFETIEALKDEDKPMDVKRARAICQVAQTIIDSARVEVKAAEVVAAELDTGFFDNPALRRLPPLPDKRLA
jgi:hypothetical protein